MSQFNLFSTPQQQQTPQPLFQTQQTPPSMFQPQQSSSFFPQPQQQQQQQPPSFQPQQFQPQQQQQNQQQQQVQQLYLFTNDKAPANYSTKWADLHPDSQKFLLQIEEKILEYRSESQRLDQCSRLYDSSVSSEGFEFDASRIVQELGGINSAMDRQKAVLQELMIVAKDMLRNAEIAVRSFMMLQPRFPHWKQGGVVSGVSQPSQPQGTNPAPPSSGQQQAVTSTLQVSDFYRGIPKKPTAFLQQTVVRFEKYLNGCHQWVEELEQLLALDSDKYNRHASLLESLPKVMSNVHDFFVHVAAKVESIHQYIESMRTSYLADQRRRRECHDPFLEADRRETAKQEAAAKRVHPTLHLPTTTSTQPSTQVAGLIASSATPGASNAPQPSAVVPTSYPSSGAGFSFLNTPASAPSSSLFATPPSAAPTSSLFGPSATPSQTSLFGSSSASTFGSAPSMFGQTTPSLGALPSQFAGATPGSGASFGSMTKSSRPKSRSTRR